MLTKIKGFVKQNRNELINGFLIFLVAMFSFSMGWILSKINQKKPIQFYYENSEITPSSWYYNGWKS